MAIYRNISLSFWTDTKVEDTFSPEDKYMYLYLLTNPHTNICGCYEISIRQISKQTGYTEDAVNIIIDKMERAHKVISYCKETKEMLIFNWGRYNWTKSDKLIKPIMAAIASIKHKPFQDYVRVMYENIEDIHTVSIPYPYGMDTTVSVTVTDTVSVTDTSKSEKPFTQKRIRMTYEHPTFVAFWSAYPKKSAKADALKALDRLQPDDVLMGTIIKAVERSKQTDQWTKDDGKYIPLPASWLNGRRWEDELPQSVQKLNAHGLPPGYSAVLSD